MKKLLIFLVPLFFSNCSVVSFVTDTQKIQKLESKKIGEIVRDLDNKKDVLMAFGPAGNKKTEEGLEFWYYTDVTTRLVAGFSNSVNVPSSVIKNEKTITFVFDGDSIVNYQTKNINLSEELNPEIQIQKDKRDWKAALLTWLDAGAIGVIWIAWLER